MADNFKCPGCGFDFGPAYESAQKLMGVKVRLEACEMCGWVRDPEAFAKMKEQMWADLQRRGMVRWGAPGKLN